MHPIDRERLTLPKRTGTNCCRSKKLPRHKAGEKFLKGPIPWNWITKASRLPGRTLHVAIAIWLLAGLSRKRTVRMSNAVLTALGVDRFAGYRGLASLEEAGLVAVERRFGCNSIVTILGVGEADQEVEGTVVKCSGIPQ